MVQRSIRWRRTFLFKNTRRGITTVCPKIKLTLRWDDRAVIEYIHREIGCGKIYSNEYRSKTGKNRNTQPWVEFRVHRIADLAEVIVPLFERYPLHTKKALEFGMWKLVVDARYKARGTRVTPEEQLAYDEVNELVEELRGRGPSNLK